MDLRHLEAFVAVATLQSFKSAANRLNITQPAISSRISAFEQEIGEVLFKRDTKPVTLTDHAWRILPSAEKILEMSYQMRSAVRVKRRAAPPVLRIGTNGVLAHSWLPRFLVSWSRSFPEVQFSVEVGVSRDILARMHDGALDVGFLSVPMDIPGFKRFHVCSLQPIVAAQPHVVPKRKLAFRELADKTFVMYGAPSATNEVIKAKMELLGVVPRTLVTSNSTGFIKHFLRTTDSLGTLLRLSIQDDLQRKELVEVDLGMTLPPFKIYCCYSATAQTLIDRSFTEHVKTFSKMSSIADAG